MTTSAEKAAKLAMLDGLLAAFNGQRDNTNTANGVLNQAIRAGDIALTPIVLKATDVVFSLNSYKPQLLAAVAETQAIVPSDPPPPAPERAALFTPNLAQQDSAGGSSNPAWESICVLKDGRFGMMGWVGGHDPEMSNAIYAFNPITKKVDTLFPWTRDAQGKNAHFSQYDNHLVAYDGKCLIQFGLGVFDVDAGQPIRGNRAPQTRPWNTYATGCDGAQNMYNSVYVRSEALDQCLFYGMSYGGYGEDSAWTDLVIWKRTGPADAPLQATVIHLAGKGMLWAVWARNNGVEYKGKFYWGGGFGAGATIANSVFTSPGHGNKDGYHVVLYPDGGDADMPAGMANGRVYYARDCTADTFRVSATPGGPALVLGTNQDGRGYNIPNYKMWSIDLATYAVELVSTEWGMGVWSYYPQLMLDAQRDRFALAGANVCTFDPTTRKWTDRTPAGYVGYKSVVGAIAADGKAYLRGTPLTGEMTPRCWQWNSIEFDAPPPPPPVVVGPPPGSATLARTSAIYASMAAAQEAAQPGDTLLLEDGGREYLNVTKSINIIGATYASQGKRSSVGRITISAFTPGMDVRLTGLQTQSTNIVAGDDTYAPGIYAIAYPGANLKLTISQCKISNWSNGILGSYAGDPGTTVAVNDCSIVDCGTGEGTEHNIYLPAIGKVTLTGHHSMLCRGGHLNKSRSYVHEYRNSNFLCLDSHASACLDFCTGGDVTVEDCVLHKGPNTDQAYNMIFYARERYGPIPAGILDRVSFKRNILINDGPIVGHQFFDEYLREGYDESTWLPHQQRRAGGTVAADLNPPIVFEGNWITGDGSADFMRRYPNNNLVRRDQIEQYTPANGLPSFRLKAA